MNDPIINPRVFYLISLCDKVSVVCTVAAVVFLVIALVLTIVMAIDGDPGDEITCQAVAIMYALGGVSALLAVFVPSGTTITAMVAANSITPETVEAVGQPATEAAEAITRVILQTIKEVR